jgi:transposase
MQLVTAAREFGPIRSVSADSAYLSRENAQHVAVLGGVPYLRPKSNTTRKGKGKRAWKKMVDMWYDDNGSFEQRYTKRWLIETCNSVIKRKWAGDLRCRSPSCQHAEMGFVLIGHNARELLRHEVIKEMTCEN